MTTLTPSVCVLIFTGGTYASKPVISFTTKTMRHIRHSPTAPLPSPQENKNKKQKKKNLKCFYTNINELA